MIILTKQGITGNLMNDIYRQMENLFSELMLYEGISKSLASTALLILTFIVIRVLISRLLKRNIASADLRRKWHVQVRNGLILLLVFGLLVIWSNELRTFALSLVAIAVAFVVATKELILCITGSILKTGSRSFNIGDRIQIKDFRGDVIDQNLLATTILEVGPGKITHQRTGRIVDVM